MKTNRLNLNKEIVANLCGTESDQIRGGTYDTLFDWVCISISCGGCGGLKTDTVCFCPPFTTVFESEGPCNDGGTGWCGDTYANCTNYECLP